jgi:signal transduction histidine kinase
MEAFGRLTSGLAHDFANLLTLISGYSEILLGRLAASDPSRPEVDEIRKAANRGASLTSQLLAYSRRNAVAPQVLDLNSLVAAMLSMLRRMIGEHIDLGTQLGSELGSVKADAGQIEQVIMNLAINARDAMPRGGKISIRTANVDVRSDHERAGVGTKPGRYVMLGSPTPDII